MWIVYALYIGDLAVLLANLFTFIFSTIILFVKFYNVRKNHERI
jgi:uncharacterized protein with PQ loop repeat